MRDETCIDFLQWALPRLHKRWPGFRKVRGQVCKRITRRLQELDLSSIGAYRSYLEARPEEWDVLDGFCRITISRFYRDRGVFDTLRDVLLPELAARARDDGRPTVEVWCAGCASGEEVYTVRIIWEHAVDTEGVGMNAVGTDVQEHMLERARRGCYQRGTLKELPDRWIDTGFEIREGQDDDEPYCVRNAYRHGITWLRQDIRDAAPEGSFDLILCRNLVFTYFDEEFQQQCLQQLRRHLRIDGYLILGKHESLPDDTRGFEAHDAHARIYRRIDYRDESCTE